MTKLQTRFAELLGIPEYAKPDWSALEKRFELSESTLREWYEAAVGSNIFLTRDPRRSTVKKIMQGLNLEREKELLVECDGDPKRAQESVQAALMPV